MIIISKVKRTSSNFIHFLVDLALGADYIIIGQVESVIYTRNNYWVCYVAMSNGDANGRHRYEWHASNSFALCEFAERCRFLEVPVKLSAIEESGNNIAEALEFANTRARWQYVL